MSTLGQAIKGLRNKKGLTQKELAPLIKTTRDTLANWEVGRATPDIESVKAIAIYFGVTTDYLLGQRDITKNDSDLEIADLLKNNGIEKARLTKEITLDELKIGIELIKTIRKQKAGN